MLPYRKKKHVTGGGLDEKVDRLASCMHGWLFTFRSFHHPLLAACVCPGWDGSQGWPRKTSWSNKPPDENWPEQQGRSGLYVTLASRSMSKSMWWHLEDRLDGLQEDDAAAVAPRLHQWPEDPECTSLYYSHSNTSPLLSVSKVYSDKTLSCIFSSCSNGWLLVSTHDKLEDVMPRVKLPV
jgi:hypothetical protein